MQLLALATVCLPALALVLLALQFCGGGDEGAPLRADACDLAAQVVRLVVRAPEVHARDTGYLPRGWIAVAVVQAELSALDEDRGQVLHLEDTARPIAAAIAANENDVMAVPERVSEAFAAGLALFASITDALSA